MLPLVVHTATQVIYVIALLSSSPAVFPDNYAPPEAIFDYAGGGTRSLDIFRMGATLYHLMQKEPPFVNSSAQDQEDARFFTGGRWDSWSDQLQDLMYLLMAKSPKERPKSDEILLHPWVVTRKRATASAVALGQATRGSISPSRLSRKSPTSFDSSKWENRYSSVSGFET